MKPLFVALCLASALLAPTSARRASAAEIRLRMQDSNTLIQIDGDSDDDWRLQSSSDLVTWSNVATFGTLIGGKTNAPWRLADAASETPRFFRALKTAGLYDPSLFRTISLTFTQANWSTLLTSARTTGSNAYCSRVTLDNGATNAGAGARYKGNTSFSRSGTKKSINVELDFTTPGTDLMTYSTFNLNNAFGDETIMREALYFTVMEQYAPCPKGAMARVNINGSLWGVYSLIQQENGQLINEWFSSNNGDRWRTPNAPGGGGFGGSNAALAYLNTTNVATYQPYYDLRTTNSPVSVAWARLINAIVVLNNTPAGQLRDRVEDVLAVDRWLWFLVLENVFADDDSYWNKGADYSFYFEPESGRLHPIEHDGNEAFVIGDVQLSPVMGATLGNRPVISQLLSIPELRQRYLAHMRTVLSELYNPAAMTPLIDAFRDLSVDAIVADPNKGFTMTAYTNDVAGLKAFVTNRYNFLTNHAELRPLAPNILSVFPPASPPGASEVPFITGQVAASGTNGLGSVWLYHRGKPYGRFAVTEMLDDGAHGDGAAEDGLFGAATTNYPAGTRVRFYIEARSTNAARAASFSPPRAEQETHSYRVALATATNTPVIINELMASNTSTMADPQGEFDDWIELRNLTDQAVDLTGRYLSDEPNNPRKWAFPPGTIIAPDGFLIVWADEDGLATPGLHASFKLSTSGEQIYLTDTDANFNAVLDTIAFGEQEPDRSFGRIAANADAWATMNPTPGAAND